MEQNFFNNFIFNDNDNEIKLQSVISNKAEHKNSMTNNHTQDERLYKTQKQGFNLNQN